MKIGSDAMKNKGFKKVYIIFIVAAVLVIIGSVFIIFIKDDIKLKDDLTVEINNKVNLLSFVNKPKKDTIITKNELVDTSKLGNIKLKIEYLNIFKQKKELNFTVKVVDTIKPEIECDDTISVEVYKGNVEEKIKVKDNSNEEIKPTIEGKYDPNVEGEYKVTVAASDKSGNKATKKITIKVTAPKLKTNGFYVAKTQEAWYSLSFKEDNTIVYNINYCPGMGCGMFSMDGTYKTEGSKITITFTHKTDDVTEREALSEPNIVEMNIKTTDLLEYKELTFNHQDNAW